MRHSYLTGLILVAALVCYAAGLSGVAPVLLAAAMGLETWFWVRLMQRKRVPVRVRSNDSWRR